LNPTYKDSFPLPRSRPEEKRGKERNDCRSGPKWCSAMKRSVCGRRSNSPREGGARDKGGEGKFLKNAEVYVSSDGGRRP